MCCHLLHGIEECEFAESGLTAIQASTSVEILRKSCFLDCESPASIAFKSDSKLQRIEESAFAASGLATAQVVAPVEVLCDFCVFNC
jgi:hypothetical protein